MDIVNPLSDYVPDSLLTTQGDIIIRGASDAERLALGSGRGMLNVNAAGNSLEYRNRGAFLKDGELQGFNASNVTVNNTWPTVLTIDLGTVTNGDRFLFQLYVRISGLSAAAVAAAAIQQSSGTASQQMFNSLTSVWSTQYALTSPDPRIVYTVPLDVTASGTLVMYVAAFLSTGSGTSYAGDSQYRVIQLAYG